MNVNLTPDELRILPKILQSLKKRNIGNVVKKNDIAISLKIYVYICYIKRPYQLK